VTVRDISGKYKERNRYKNRYDFRGKYLSSRIGGGYTSITSPPRLNHTIKSQSTHRVPIHKFYNNKNYSTV
jgi:hypothetical protein